jgi:iron complex transport system permease protein
VTTIAVMGLALAVGSVDVRPGDVVHALFGGESGTAASVVRDLRLPRAVAAFAVGGLLAVAGSLMQVLLRNPLADPYVLGLSGGAACGASPRSCSVSPRWRRRPRLPARACRRCSCSGSRAGAARGRRRACC